ncbi:Sphingomyelin phosphodiesterase 2, neutral membrane (Neutral sphingomyelinase) [Globomyces sp. JEL0801]|nr:Sphingomyelin phosphodiesterase 2, neutral membrane (Neutral sphingomyelinase) [Globomyces sp. JEL0801]
MKFLTLNMYLRPPFIQSNGGDYKWERVEELLKVLADYDVVVLQECFKAFSSRANYLIQRAADIGLIYHAVPISNWLDFQIDGGFLVLSRYPLENQDFCKFKNSAHSDSLAAKGCFYTEIIINSVHLQIFTTHTQASYDDLQDQTPALEARKSQFEQIAKFIQEKKKVNQVCILAGDFNVDGLPQTNDKSHSDEYQNIYDILSHNATFQWKDIIFDKLGHHPITTSSIHKLQPDTCSKCLDYVFIHNESSRFIVEDCQIQEFKVDQNPKGITNVSDHCGVSFNFNIQT